MHQALFGAALLPLALGCSYVELPYLSSNNGTAYMIARSMELGNIMGGMSYDLRIVPAKDSGGRFGYLGVMNVFRVPVIGETAPADGMNEAGLTISALELDQSVYEQEQEGANSIKVEDVVGNVLAHCDSVEESLNYLASVRVVGGNLARLGMGLHWAIADASGKSVVVEYLEGKRVVYDNVPRVMTNDPDLPWHWRNLNTHTSLSPNYSEENEFLQVQVGSGVGTVPRTVGHGWNLFGLPGDSAPPSRFVRLFYLRGYALHQRELKDHSDAVVLGTALLNNVFIPYGVIPVNKARGPGVERPEYTPYGLLKSAADRQVLFRGYRNSQWRLIDLNKVDFSVAQSWPLEDGTLGIEDVTAKPSQRQVGSTVV